MGPAYAELLSTLNQDDSDGTILRTAALARSFACTGHPSSPVIAFTIAALCMSACNAMDGGCEASEADAILAELRAEVSALATAGGSGPIQPSKLLTILNRAASTACRWRFVRGDSEA